MIKLERWKTVTVKKMVGMVGAKGLSSMNEIFVGMKHVYILIVVVVIQIYM